MQPLFLHHMFFRQIKYPHLGRQDQSPIIHHIVPGRAKAVTVKDCPHHIPVGKYDGCRPVPGFHHGGIILIEIPLFLRERFIVHPRLRNQYGCGKRKIHSTHHQELQGIIQHGRIRALLGDHREYFCHIILGKQGSMHGFLSGQHLIRVPFYGIDFPVMHDKAVGMCPVPAGCGVGGKTGVNHSDGGLIVRFIQIAEEGSQLIHQKHSFINDGPAGQRRNIGVFITLLKLSSHDVQHPFKIKIFLDFGRPFDKDLID